MILFCGRYEADRLHITWPHRGQMIPFKMPLSLTKPATKCVFPCGEILQANMLYIKWPSPLNAPCNVFVSPLSEADRLNLNQICCIHTKGSSLIFCLLFASSFSRDDWHIQRNTHPTYETLWVPQRVESRYVVFQDGLTAALTAWRKQSQEALLAVLLAVTVMEACWRNGSDNFKCFFQFVHFFPSPVNINLIYSFKEYLFAFIKDCRCLCQSLLWS